MLLAGEAKKEGRIWEEQSTAAQAGPSGCCGQYAAEGQGNLSGPAFCAKNLLLQAKLQLLFAEASGWVQSCACHMSCSFNAKIQQSSLLWARYRCMQFYNTGRPFWPAGRGSKRWWRQSTNGIIDNVSEEPWPPEAMTYICSLTSVILTMIFPAWLYSTVRLHLSTPRCTDLFYSDCFLAAASTPTCVLKSDSDILVAQGGTYSSLTFFMAPIIAAFFSWSSWMSSGDGSAWGWSPFALPPAYPAVFQLFTWGFALLLACLLKEHSHRFPRNIRIACHLLDVQHWSYTCRLCIWWDNAFARANSDCVLQSILTSTFNVLCNS